MGNMQINFHVVVSKNPKKRRAWIPRCSWPSETHHLSETSCFGVVRSCFSLPLFLLSRSSCSPALPAFCSPLLFLLLPLLRQETQTTPFTNSSASYSKKEKKSQTPSSTLVCLSSLVSSSSCAGRLPARNATRPPGPVAAVTLTQSWLR
jgi:hypothetical protein